MSNVKERETIIEVTVVHPTFGHVKFSNPTPRQVEILQGYAKLTETNFKYRGK